MTGAGERPAGHDQSTLYVPEVATIVRARDLTPRDILFVIELPGRRNLGHMPGQFVQVSVFGYGEAPISVCSPPEKQGAFDLCIRNLGSVTGALHALDAGDKVGVRGPFGRGFPIDSMKHMDVLIVAGGIGLAPLRSIIDSVFLNRDEYGRLVVLYGTGTPEEILFPAELEAWQLEEGNEILVTVDEGGPDWPGNVGVITTLFSKVDIDPVNTVVAALVGPPVMYRFVLMELEGLGIPEEQIFFSLERRMKCGVGKCGNCQVEDVYVCVDGPVFSGGQIKKLHESI